MNSHRLLLLIIPMLSACQKAQPAIAYRHWTDQMIVRTGLLNLGAKPCKHARSTDECFKMQPARHWSGEWVTHFEDNRFCPGACLWDKPSQFHLEWLRSAFRNRAPIQAQSETVYSVHFIGRRTEFPVGSVSGGYLIVVDQLLSMKEVAKVPNVEDRFTYTIAGQ